MGRGGLLQTESRSFRSADGCAVSAPCGEESAWSFALRPENRSRPVPDVPLARLRMARALGLVCAPRPLGSLARSALKQVPAHRSRDKYTRRGESPRASGLLPVRCPSGQPSRACSRPLLGPPPARHHWAVPRKAHRVLPTSCRPSGPSEALRR